MDTKSIGLALLLLFGYSATSVAAEDSDFLLSPGVESLGDHGVAEETEVSLEDFIEFPSLDCLDYCFKGVCIFLDCGITGCWIETSPQIKHNNPDVVVSVYREPGENPWLEVRELFGELQKEVLNEQVDHLIAPDGRGVGGGGDQIRSTHTRPLVYREADAFGHPFNLGDWAPEIGGLICGSQTYPFQPVFQSAFDGYNWRVGLGELIFIAEALPGMSVVGTPFLNNWGKVYRRTGFISQYNYPKANAVIAQRVGSIITRAGQPHVYYPLTRDPGGRMHYVDLPPPLDENSPDGGVWRMIAPTKDSGCYVFGQDTPITNPWSDGRHAEDKAAVFELWRPYDCCRDRGSLIETVETPEICL